MKTSGTKLTALLLSAALLCGTAGIAAHAAAAGEEAGESRTEAAPAGTMAPAGYKDEAVYVLAGADGCAQKVIVSDWLKNPDGAARLEDTSDLTGIEPVKGTATVTSASGNTYVWDAQGCDIYYQGTSEQALPVEIQVRYWLDGEPVTPEELAGKSGSVTIRFDYLNHQTQQVQIGGKSETMYVPFAVLTGVVLDTDVFSNVEVKNAKLLNDGDRIAVLGAALPGMQENLAIEEQALEIPDYVEITADVENFKLGMTLSIATNALFDRIDTEQLDSVDGLQDALSQLTDAMEQLLDGSSQLYEGLETLLEKSGELADGVGQLADGAGALTAGAGQLDSGAAELQSGASQLANGLNTLNSNSGTLTGGAEQVFQTLLGTANAQLAAAGLSVPEMTVSNYAAVLDGVIASLDENAVYEQARAAVAAAVEEQRPYITEQVTAAVRAEVTAQVTAAVQAQVGEEQMASEQAQAMIAAQVEQQMASEAVQAVIAAKTQEQIDQAIAAHMADDAVQAQLAAASAGAQQVTALKASLDSYNTFYLGLQSYTAGVAQAASGANDLKAGAGTLKSGTASLYAGAGELEAGVAALQENVPALLDGITQLRDGAKALSDGLTEFDEQGVQALVDAVDGDLDGLVERLRATVELSGDYRTFSGAGTQTDGQVQFIYRTDEIRAEPAE